MEKNMYDTEINKSFIVIFNSLFKFHSDYCIYWLIFIDILFLPIPL